MGIKKRLTNTWLAIGGAVTTTQHAVAELPSVSAPSRGESDGNFIKLIQDYGYDLVMLASLGVASIAFLVVANNVISTYREIQKDRKTWGDLAAHGGVGAVLLVGVIFLMNEVKGIL